LASTANCEANRGSPHGRPVLLRLLAYARPYAALIALTLLLSGALSAGRYARVYLLKPILDDVVLPHQALTSSGSPGAWLPELGDSGGGERVQPAPPPAPLEDERRAELERIRDDFTGILLVALVVVLAVPALQFGHAYLVQYALGRIYIDIQRDVCFKLLALPLRFHHGSRRGDTLSRMMRDVNEAHSALDLLFGNLMQAIVMIFMGAAVLVYISWQLALVSALLGPAVFAVISIFNNRILRSARRRQEKFGDVTQRILEILSGIKVIKSFRAEAIEDAAFRRETRQLFRRSMKVVKNRVLARSLVELLNNGAVIGLTLLGAILVLGGRWGLTVGDLAAFAGVLSQTYRPVKTLAKSWVRVVDAQPAAQRFLEVLDTPVEVRDAPDAVALDRAFERVELRGVSFSYGREPVLRDVSFDVRAGEMVAIVGPTGAGKTTLIDILLRFHDPTSGSVEIDGVDLRQITRDSLLGHMAVVTQEPFLFDGTIRENLLYGRPDASEEQMLAAARAAYVDAFARDLPDGYDTQVGADGARLSGGQRQRITIARAILRDPAILIFDEATSSLDSKSERYVQEAIDVLIGGRTVFVIAHRLSTIRRADKIVVLEDGGVTQIGTHAELVRKGGLYRELADLQMVPEPPDDLELRPSLEASAVRVVAHRTYPRLLNLSHSSSVRVTSALGPSPISSSLMDSCFR
jgi:subfamily B ATP-binding cassette protein MsbA